MLYQPRCIVAFDAQQKHNISSFRNFASEILKIFEKFVGFQGKFRKIKGKNWVWTGVLVVGRVRQVGQIGQVNWYAMCQSTTIKTSGQLTQKTPQTGKKKRRQAEKRKTTSRLPGEPPGDRRNSQRHHFLNHAAAVGGCIARQGRRQIKAAAKECTTVLD